MHFRTERTGERQQGESLFCTINRVRKGAKIIVIRLKHKNDTLKRKCFVQNDICFWTQKNGWFFTNIT